MISFRSFLFLLVSFAAAVSAGTNSAGLEFLAKKAAEPGVVKLDSGLMYKGMSYLFIILVWMLPLYTRIMIHFYEIQYCFDAKCL
jgi:hypothetical protein